MVRNVSVIVPVWNREHLIERCLDSIVSQTEKPMELIVVDNASTDSTYHVVEKWFNERRGRGIKFQLLSETKKGACNARQKGLENAQGEYVIFFDSDDRMLPNLIERVFKELSNRHDLDVVFWKCRIHQLDGSEKIPHFDASNPIENHLVHTLLRPQGYVIRKDFLNICGGWKKPVKVWNDFELGLRILLNNPKINGIEEVLAEIYSQEESITGTDFSSREGEWEKVLDEMDRVNSSCNHQYKKRINTILNYRRAILAAHYLREGNKEGAKRLMNFTLKNKGVYEKLLLNFSYRYTGKGYRGAWWIVGKLM